MSKKHLSCNYSFPFDPRNLNMNLNQIFRVFLEEDVEGIISSFGFNLTFDMEL